MNDWTPEPGKACLLVEDGDTCTVLVRHVDGQRAWVKYLMDVDGDPGGIVWVEDLGPLPDENKEK